MADTLVALRVGASQWLADPVFAQLLTFLELRPEAVDELAFFTSATHAPLPLAEVERRAARLGHLLPQVRARGYGAGINVLTQQADPLDEYLPFLDEMERMRPFLERLRTATAQATCQGVWPAWNRNIFADRGVAGDWLQRNASTAALQQPYTLAGAGAAHRLRRRGRRRDGPERAAASRL